MSLNSKKQSTLKSFLTKRVRRSGESLDRGILPLDTDSADDENTADKGCRSDSNEQFTLNNSLNTDEPIIMSDIADDSDVSSDTYSGAQGVSAESENMDSRQPSFTLGKHPRQSVSISSDVETESTDSLCVAECCNGADKPYQPRISYSRLSKRKQGKCFRSFQSSWYSSFNWLSYCLTHNKVFCYYCRTATASRLVTFSKKSNDAFVSVGFDNWKKALKGLGSMK